jgi:hypothetical protein
MPRDISGPTWVYRLTGADNELLYVGVAVNIEQRFTQHRATKHWWPDVIFMDCERYPTRRIALDVERFYIQHEHPYYNVQNSVPLPEHGWRPTGRASFTNRGPLAVLEGHSGEWR